MSASRVRPLDVLLAAVLLVGAATAILAGAQKGPPAVTWPVAVLVTAPLAMRRTRPLSVLAVVTVAVAAQTAWGVSLSSIPELLALVVAVFTVASLLPPFVSVLAAAVSAVVQAAGLLGLEGAGPADVLFVVVLLGAPGFAGWSIRSHRLYADMLTERAALVERGRAESERRAVRDERARIALEMHDVVTHHLSIAVIQLVATDGLLDAEGDHEAVRHLGSAEASCRSALSEMRALLEVVGEAPSGGRGPEPGMAGIDDLVTKVREAGLPVTVAVEGAAAPLGEGRDLAAYRIVQEALTNAIKHGGCAPTTLTVRYTPRAVEIEVRDEGPGSTRPRGSGRGVAGMRDRAALYGGAVDIGPHSGGFHVRATLPLAAPST